MILEEAAEQITDNIPLSVEHEMKRIVCKMTMDNKTALQPKYQALTFCELLCQDKSSKELFDRTTLYLRKKKTCSPVSSNSWA
jgi:hypothetical protein